MLKYIAKRLMYAVLIIVGVSILIYLLVMMMPQDYVDNKTAGAVQNGSMSAADVLRLKKLYGLADKSFFGIISSYFNWVGNVFTGNLGHSFVFEKPVTAVIGDYVWLSFAIAAIAFVVEIMIAVPLGIKAAVKQYSVYDYSATLFSVLGIALPSFFLSTLLINLFSINLGWFPLTGITTATKVLTGFDLFLDKVWHLILPLTVSIILGIGGLMRYVRTNMLEVLNADYIRTARAKGVSEKNVIYRHAFKNTMIPLVTTLGGMLPGLFSGMMILETVFAIPGIGEVAFRATRQGDIPFVMGYNMFLAILSIVGILIADLLYVVVDPRVKLE